MLGARKKLKAGMDTFEDLKRFVAGQRWEYGFPLTRDTTLREDLRLWGDDAVEFIAEFGKKFDVDLSELQLEKYFPPEGDLILPALLRALRLRKQPKYITITLGDLEESIKKKKLL